MWRQNGNTAECCGSPDRADHQARSAALPDEQAREIGHAVQMSLSPKHQQSRLPNFAEVTLDRTAAIRGEMEEVMNRENSRLDC